MTDEHGPNHGVGVRERRKWLVIYAVVAVLVLGQTSSNVISTIGVFRAKDAADAARDAAHAIHRTQLKGSPTSKRLIALATATKAIADQLNDCLHPTGKCAKRSQRQTSNVVSLILVGVSCSQGYAGLPDAQRIEATQSCVAEWLSHHPRLSSL
jgi:hypothetical protein